MQLRCATFIELAEGLDYFFRADDGLEYEDKGKRKFLTPDYLGHLERLASIVEGAEPFDETKLEADVNAWVLAEDIKMKDVAQPARVALTGRMQSPGLYETLVLLGRESALTRLRRGAAVAATNVD